jgi:uncharacterized coiled-coil DUF342 family protein
MGLADKLKNLTKKAEDAAATHKEQVHNAVVKAEELADRQTGGQYHEQIVNAGQKADAFVDRLEEPATAPTAPQHPAPGAAPQERGS